MLQSGAEDVEPLPKTSEIVEPRSGLDDTVDNSKVTEATKDKKIEAVDVFECAISQ